MRYKGRKRNYGRDGVRGDKRNEEGNDRKEVIKTLGGR